MKLRAKKSLGQNFLHHPGTLGKILKAAELAPSDTVIEIGPGKGVLTEKLLEAARHVTAVELDDRLIPLLEEKFKDHQNFTLHHGDALEFIPPKEPYKIVANIPYYITSPLLNHFLKEQPQERRPKSLTLLVQKEVAQKITAQPGDLNVLALQVQLFGKPRLVAKIPAAHFKPAPKVDSAILQIDLFEKPLVPDAQLESLFKLIHAGFGHKRKKLLKNLKPLGLTAEQFKSNDLDENARAQDLSIEDWLRLLG